ncbi:hypothetical protein F4777DRAFT_593221 [Nemania sp. FL0916]|nr:hypothetical protein F4777DRAFT_593221 [Nemania sp. FL0916]
MEPIAIIGCAFKLPGNIFDEQTLWQVLQEGRNTASMWPLARTTLSSQKGHFLSEDQNGFDAKFFSITAQEATSMDPQQMWALEAAYHAFENAGISMEQLKGSKTAVFTGSMAYDMCRIFAKDPDTAPIMTATGTAMSILANRISWFFDLQGASVHVDTACSSSMAALDLACQALRTGDATTALVIGSSILLTPETSKYLSNMSLLSPDGLSFSFDHRANGYGRGEGVVALVLERVVRSIESCHVIRAVIRSTGTNQDGRTPTLTQPSARSQAKLIRDVYAKAGLDPGITRYIEAHGTGTAVGDPIEMNSLRDVFGEFRSPQTPLYVGSLKANFGHLEGASGILGILKAILILERGIIPPQANFEKLNPNIDVDSGRIHVITQNLGWPSQGLRRVSVNSFGVGGTNSHVVLDDAYHFMEDRKLKGLHRCDVKPYVNGDLLLHSINSSRSLNGAQELPNAACSYQLLIWSAADEAALRRMIRDYQDFISGAITTEQSLHQLVTTLTHRRSRLLWRALAVVETAQVCSSGGLLSEPKPVRSSDAPNACFVFTGQGAQYAGMGLALCRYHTFEKSLRESGEIFRSLGAEWDIFEALRGECKLHEPDYSQPLCSALQIALVDLLEDLAILPAFVVGHSSGEIAAAYSIGALSRHSACKVAYFRGLVSGKLKRRQPSGAMIAIQLPQQDIPAFLGSLKPQIDQNDVTVACVNSPFNCTLAAPEVVTDIVQRHANKIGVWTHKLDVGVPYHSPFMHNAADEYIELMGTLEERHSSSSASMVSSVTGEIVDRTILKTTKYWVKNLVSKVQFSIAMLNCLQPFPHKGSCPIMVTEVIEIGPHAALQRPLRDIIQHQISLDKERHKIGEINYLSALNKSKSAELNFLELLGQLFCLGYNINMAPVVPFSGGNGIEHVIDYPKYPFDHSRTSWKESRLSSGYRLPGGSGEYHVLGARSNDWCPMEPRWRTFPNQETLPWLGDHIISGKMLFPGTGMIVMAIEAVKQMASSSRPIISYMIKEAHFLSPIFVGKTLQDGHEAVISLRTIDSLNGKYSTHFEVKIHSYVEDRWSEAFRATIQSHYAGGETSVDGGKEHQMREKRIVSDHRKANSDCKFQINHRTFYTFMQKHGFQYGKNFRVLKDIKWDGSGTSVARIDAFANNPNQPRYPHPIDLDAALHLVMTQVSKGLKHPIDTMVPHKLFNMWLSARGSCGAQLHVMSTVSQNSFERGAQATISITNDQDSVVCVIGNFCVSSVADRQVDKLSISKPQLLHKIEWQPRLSSLNSNQLNDLCKQVGNGDQRWAEKIGYMERLELAIIAKATSVLANLPSQARHDNPIHITRLMEKIEELGQQTWYSSQSLPFTTVEQDSVLEGLEHEQPDWKVFPVVARSLDSILRGKTDPLELMFSTNLAEDFYASTLGMACDERLELFMNLASHENPNLRILEVGAGTGGLSRHILSLLRKHEALHGGQSFSAYDYTDISASYFEAAKEHFHGFENRVRCRQFDLERDPLSQGFLSESYDIIIAGSVLHATSNLATTLKHVRKLLKHGGYLINIEVVDTQNAALNIGFGVLPGWWNCAEEWRAGGPLVSKTQWHNLLQQAQFSGNDVTWSFQGNRASPLCAVMIAKGCDEALSEKEPEIDFTVLVNDQSDTQVALASMIGETHNSKIATTNSILKDASLLRNSVVVVLLDVNKKFLASLSKEQFKSLQSLLLEAKDLIWVATNSPAEIDYPYAGLMNGLLRTTRIENIEKRIVSLTLETSTSRLDLTETVRYISEVARLSFCSESPEREYIVRGEQLTVGRLAEKVEMTQTVRASISPSRRLEPWGQSPPCTLVVGKLGLLDSIHFAEDLSSDDDRIEYSEIEVESHTWPINFRDVFVALGRFPGESLGTECAGIVRKAGSKSSFKPGDRVYVWDFAGNLIRPSFRCRSEFAVRVPDLLSLEEAAALAGPGITAYYSLMNIARLQKGEKILIHSATGATGQMAVMVAKMVGAEIFATVGLEEKKEYLIKHHDIPAEHIFSSRDATFADGLRRVCGQVDVILNSVSGDLLQASWECIAPYGRFIEIGKTDIANNSPLNMACFAKNVSFHAVDLRHIVISKPEYTMQLGATVLELAAGGIIGAPMPLNTFMPSQAEQAFRYMQSGKQIGRILLMSNPADEVWKLRCEKSTWQFDANASYVVAGGLGGLGRSIIKWMTDKGARHLILLSRSGGSSAAASSAIADLKMRGINIFAPMCDVSCAAALEIVLERCRTTMPPIKGCINAAMVLQDAVFGNMTHDQWQTTLRSKVDSSWNLHKALPRQLDFFILLSSLSGIYGSISQSNYAAGCTFQDSLARHRTMSGEKSISIDVGWMKTIGIVSENEEYQRTRTWVNDMHSIEENELLALLDIYCDPSCEIPSPDHSQVLIGAKTPADFLAERKAPIQSTRVPLFARFAQSAKKTATSGDHDNTHESSEEPSSLFRKTSDINERAHIVQEALKIKLSQALYIPPAEIDPEKSLVSYGVDSLMGIELRNWFIREFQATLNVFDFMGNQQICAVAQAVAANTTSD